MQTERLEADSAWRLWLMLQHLGNMLWHIYEKEFVQLEEYEQLKRGEGMPGDCTNGKEYPF